MARTLAINGGEKVRTSAFPPWPVLGDDDGNAARRRSAPVTSLSSPAPTSATSSGLRRLARRRRLHRHQLRDAAIHSVLAALEIGPGDEVIVPAHTFIASATPVLHQHATPVFADVDARSFCLDPASVRERMTERTKAIVAVHLNGHPADLDPLVEIANEHGIRADRGRRTGPRQLCTRAGSPGRSASPGASASGRTRS